MPATADGEREAATDDAAALPASAAADHAGTARRLPLVLLIDAALVKLPWECMPVLRQLPVSRLPCGAFLDGSGARPVSHRSVFRSGDAFYVLNPANDLMRTQVTFEKDFCVPPWQGIAGSAPSAKVLEEALSTKDLYVYCGHSHGGQYLSQERVMALPRCSVALLGGCSSAALMPHGVLAPTGYALSYMHAHCPALVGSLWDVTDGEIDRVWKALISHCTEGGCLLDALVEARTACKLPYLTGAAIVTYGVPLTFVPRGHTQKQGRSPHKVVPSQLSVS